MYCKIILILVFSAPAKVTGPQAPNEKCLADELQEALIRSVHQTDNDDDVFLPDSKTTPKVYPKFSCKFLEELLQVRFDSVSKNTRAYLDSDNFYLKEDSSDPSSRERETSRPLDINTRKRDRSLSSDLNSKKRETSLSSDLTARKREASLSLDTTAKRLSSTSSDVTTWNEESSITSDVTPRTRGSSTSSDGTPKKQPLSVASGGGRKDDNDDEGRISLF